MAKKRAKATPMLLIALFLVSLLPELRLFARSDRTNTERAAIQRALNGGTSASELAEFILVSVKRVDLLPHDQGIFLAVLNAHPRAFRWSLVFGHVGRTTHRIADGSRQCRLGRRGLLLLACARGPSLRDTNYCRNCDCPNSELPCRFLFHLCSPPLWFGTSTTSNSLSWPTVSARWPLESPRLFCLDDVVSLLIAPH